MEKDNLSWLSRCSDFLPEVPEWPAGMINGQFRAVLIMRDVTLMSCFKFVKAKLEEKLHFKIPRNSDFFLENAPGGILERFSCHLIMTDKVSRFREAQET